VCKKMMIVSLHRSPLRSIRSTTGVLWRMSSSASPVAVASARSKDRALSFTGFQVFGLGVHSDSCNMWVAELLTTISN
jgi:hypothetical protein